MDQVSIGRGFVLDSMIWTDEEIGRQDFGRLKDSGFFVGRCDPEEGNEGKGDPERRFQSKIVVCRILAGKPTQGRFANFQRWASLRM